MFLKPTFFNCFDTLYFVKKLIWVGSLYANQFFPRRYLKGLLKLGVTIKTSPLCLRILCVSWRNCLVSRGVKCSIAEIDVIRSKERLLNGKLVAGAFIIEFLLLFF